MVPLFEQGDLRWSLIAVPASMFVDDSVTGTAHSRGVLNLARGLDVDASSPCHVIRGFITLTTLTTLAE